MIKKSFPLIIILMFSFNIFSQKLYQKKIKSDILNASRDIRVYLPEGYDKDDKKNYPLAVVLDAEYLFDTYVGNSVLFAAKDKAPKQIVVGISMKKTRKKDTYFNKINGKLTADNTDFYQFISDEMIPYIENNYRTSPFISLIGEGTSANLISHFLKEPKPFINSYICINPSFSDFIVQQMRSYNLSKLLQEDNTFYFYTNNSSSFSAKKASKIADLQRDLSSVKLKNFNIINDGLKTSSNVSAMSEAIPRALTKVFEIYSGISKEEFEKNIKHLSPPDAITYLENKYMEIDFLFGSNLGIRERDIYAIESIIIEKEEGIHLKDFGVMILNLFPSSPLGNYYIGRFYEDSKQTEKAIFEYKKGYGKMDPSDPNTNAYYENILRLGGK